MKKRAIALTTLILLTGCASNSVNSQIVKVLHNTTDKKVSARHEALFYKLYPGDTASEATARICAAKNSGASDEAIASNSVEESLSLVSSGKITQDQLSDSTVINAAIILVAKQNCK